MGKDDEFGVLAGLVGLERGRVRTEPVGMAATWLTVRTGDLALAQGGDESDQQQGPGATHVRFAGRPRVFHRLIVGQAATTSNSYGGISGAACSDGAR